MRKVKQFLLVFNLLIILCTSLAFASPIIHPEKSTIPGLMGLLFPVLLIANAVFVVLWASMKQWFFLLSLGIIVLGWNRISAFMQITPREDNQTVSLSIATYNVFQFKRIDTEKAREDAIGQIISDLGSPDILCLQEARSMDKMIESTGYAHSSRIAGSLSYILSRYPIIQTEQLIFDGQHSLSGWADIELPGDTVRLFLLYLTSSRVTQETEHLIEDARIQDRKTWVEIRNLLGKYSRASIQRARQADVVASHIEQSPFPVIICGDFNDIPQSYTYAQIAKGLNDSFISCGQGIGTTYGGGIPGLRIDYILADPTFEFTTHRVPRLTTSDHYPVIAQIQITDL